MDVDYLHYCGHYKTEKNNENIGCHTLAVSVAFLSGYGGINISLREENGSMFYLGKEDII